MTEADQPESGISPVIGIILMVAVSVGLVALSATLIFDISGNVDEPSTGFSVSIEPQPQANTIRVEVIRNPSLQRVFVRGEGVVGRQDIVDSKGETGIITITPSSSDGSIEVVGVTEDGDEQVLDTEEYDGYSGMVSNDGGSNPTGEPFIIRVDTSETGDTANDEFRVSTNPGARSYSYNVSWSKVSGSTSGNTIDVSGNHVIDTDNPGVYEIRIDGQFPQMKYDGVNSDSVKITSIEQWGDIEWQSMNSMFNGAENLDSYNAADDPDLSTVRSTRSMFRDADQFNGDISSWNTENVRIMADMFKRADSFNGDISGWNTKNVLSTSGMFDQADSFNSDISSWNTSRLGFADGMFVNNDGFNQNISTWCVSQFSSEPSDFAKNSPIEGTSKVPTWGSSDGC